ncbi:MAG: sensor histidine kinase [Bacteroidota bacterium]
MKLLYKSLKAYVLFSIFVLLISIPAFYFEIKHIVAEDVDEDLISQKEDIAAKLQKVSEKNPFEFLETFEPDIYIKPSVTAPGPDSFYTITEFDTISRENVPHRVLESSVVLSNANYTIKIKSSLVDNDDLIESIVLVQAIIIVLIVAGLLLINRYHSKKLWYPFYTTLERLHSYKLESEESIDLPETKIDEFADLNKTLTNITNRNRNVFLSQKEFTENASHEMQTPLAVLQSKLELLMQTNPITNEQADLIAELSQTAQRINRLNKSLLLLSKIDNNQFFETEQVSIDATVIKLTRLYKNAINQKNISLHTRLTEDVGLTANQTLIDILIGNLLSNAIRHNIAEGSIEIDINRKSLSISNTGKFLALDQSRLFQRFQKQSIDSDSVGLGLEMVKRICNLYKAGVTYSYKENLHTFTIRFNIS